jgi:hypothetical protein
MRIAWVTQGTHDEAAITMAGLLSAKLVVARDGSWSVTGREGRLSGGKAMSTGFAKQAALLALKELLQAAAVEIDSALKAG